MIGQTLTEILSALVQQLAQNSEENELLKPVVDIYEAFFFFLVYSLLACDL